MSIAESIGYAIGLRLGAYVEWRGRAEAIEAEAADLRAQVDATKDALAEAYDQLAIVTRRAETIEGAMLRVAHRHD